MSLDWFAAPLYGDSPAGKDALLLPILRQQMLDGAERCPPFKRFLDAQRIHPANAATLAELPFLPVSAFKRLQPLCFLDAAQIYRVLESSATSGQLPSRIAIDRDTAKLMTKGVTAILADFIGSQRRPYLVVDRPPHPGQGGAANARSAAIQGLMAFSTETCYALRPAAPGEESRADPDGLVLDVDVIAEFCRRHGASNVVAYGFTYVVYLHLGGGLVASSAALAGLRQKLGGALLPRSYLLHSGGWKKLQQISVDKATFNANVSAALGADARSVIDYYGMVEQLGVVYPDCSEGNKHAPRFAEVILRNPLDWSPCVIGQHGLIQVLSALSPSFPGQALLTEDMGVVVHEDRCPCGRRGMAFRFAGRVPKAEVRGCSDVQRRRAA
ncbi:MAG: acyl-protein synthetase [Zoogloeaceae bacterium]|nr:acyl-protein synthetase [Zoogloeaceae bacterium]MCG3168444.1 hypothetical protein [Bacteroidia bacterium]HNQ56243.1 acyl-protein synthetase [Candidatus Desulfobacillus denitrificans]HNT61502.1 acyl-protein synthetase [Candidatus Desulfobacillus denitrificans]